MTADQERAEREAAADQACRDAVRLVVLSYLAETHGRPLNSHLRAERIRAERMAAGLVEWQRKLREARR